MLQNIVFVDGGVRWAIINVVDPFGGIEISLVAMNPSILKVMKRLPLWERLGYERIFVGLDQAVEHFQRQSSEDS